MAAERMRDLPEVAVMTAMAAIVAATAVVMMARRRHKRDEWSVLACLDDFDSGAA